MDYAQLMSMSVVALLVSYFCNCVKILLALTLFKHD